MSDEFRESFFARNRRALAIAGAVVVVVALVLFYRASAPKPTPSSSGVTQAVSNAPALQVGALPVT